MRGIFLKSKFLLLVIILVLLFNPCLGLEEINSEALSLKAENGNLIIEIAKKYPQIRFQTGGNKVSIELKKTLPHKKFNFDDIAKKSILEKLAFISDISINLKEDANESFPILITTKEDGFIPKVLSTKQNLITIAFEKKSLQPKSESVADIMKLYNQAVEEHSKGNLAQAADLYKEVLSYNDEFYLAKFNLAKIYLDRQMYDESVTILLGLVRELEKSKDAPEEVKQNLIFVHNNLGIVFFLRNSYAEAMDEFLTVLKLDPASYQAYYNMGLVYEKTKNIKLAIEAFKESVRRSPTFVEAYYHIGVLSLLVRNKEEALMNFKKVLEIAPESSIGKLSQIEIQKIEKKSRK